MTLFYLLKRNQKLQQRKKYLMLENLIQKFENHMCALSVLFSFWSVYVLREVEDFLFKVFLTVFFFFECVRSSHLTWTSFLVRYKKAIKL